jgi:tape measure domain-containing protein
MSTAPLDLKIAVIGANKLDKLVKRMDALEGEVARLNKTLPKASNNIKKVGTSSAGAARQTSAFAKAVGGLATAFASIQVGAGFAEAVKDARALELSGRRLKLLTTEYSQFNGVQKQAERLATKFQVSIADSSKALFSLGSRLGSQGTTLDEIVSVYEGLNSALIVTGRSAQEAASANYQLSQALGSGKLTGDELRTIVETLPELLNEIAKQAGKSADQIRQMAKDGELTTDIIIKATKALGKKYADAVEKSITVNQKFGNSIQGVSEKIGKSLLPVIDPLQLALIDFFNAVIELPDPLIAVGTAATAAAVGIGALQASLSLLGLPGVISLFGKLAIALAGITGVTKSVVTGFTAAGAAIKATTLVVTTQTVALGALKIAMLAVPWVLLAAGLTAVGVAAYKATQRIRTMREVMNTAGGTTKELKSAMVTLENEIKRIEKKMEQGGNQARGYKRQIEELKKALENVKGIYDIQVRLRAFLDTRGVDTASLDQGFYGPGGSSGAVDVETPTVPTGGGGEDTGNGSAPRASDAPQLRRDLKLAQELFALNSQLIDAELNRNKLRIEGIEITKIGLETAKEIADVKASDLYDDEKALAIEKLKVNEAEKIT